MENLLDLVLHPVRMRIVMALAGRQLTAQQMAETLQDVSPATLYRHLSRLTAAGVLQIVTERHIRGTLEKVYALNSQGPQMSAQEFSSLSREDHLRYFTTFTASLLDDFSRYLKNSEQLNLVTDGVGYRKILLELSDEEFAAMGAAINAAVIPFLKNEPAPGRKRRIFTSIVMPDLPPNAGANLNGDLNPSAQL